MSVCLLPLSQPNRQMYKLEFGHGGQVKVYIGQVHSHSQVHSQVHNAHWGVQLTSDNIVLVELPKKNLSNTTWCVFKVYAFFFSILF